MKSKQVLSKEAKTRLKWLEHYAKFTNARLTCRHFGISPSTFYHWKRKYKPEDLTSLEDIASRRPKNLRKPRWDYKTLVLINRFLEHRPGAKNKAIEYFLATQNVHLSSTTVWRMMKLLASHKK